jgi:hypothetical protein
MNTVAISTELEIYGHLEAQVTELTRLLQTRQVELDLLRSELDTLRVSLALWICFIIPVFQRSLCNLTHMWAYIVLFLSIFLYLAI